MRYPIKIILLSILIAIGCNNVGSYKPDNIATTKITDTSNKEIYEFVNYLTEHKLLFIDSNISIIPFNFPDDSNKAEIKRMLITKEFAKQNYYLSYCLYNCITTTEMKYMFDIKKKHANFKWDRNRLKNLSSLDTNGKSSVSIPLFTPKKDKAIICIAYFGNQICNSFINERLFQRKNGVWVETDNFGNEK